MTEAMSKKPYVSPVKDEGHQRIKEFVDTTKTPQEERDDPRRGDAGKPDATTK